MRQLAAFFEQQNLPMLAQAGNFITVKFGESAVKISQALLKAGVIVRPLLPYKMSEYLRISVGTKQENDYFIQQCEKVLAEFR